VLKPSAARKRATFDLVFQKLTPISPLLPVRQSATGALNENEGHDRIVSLQDLALGDWTPVDDE
jgi:hypothetical protein